MRVLSLLVLLLGALAVAQANLDVSGVVNALGRYANELNALVALSPGAGAGGPASCNFGPTNLAQINASAIALIDNNFSKFARSYVVQLSNGVVTNNMTVGGNGNLGGSPVAPANSAQFLAILKNFYFGFTGFFFSAPTHWLYSTPQVSINYSDRAYGFIPTATVTLENESRGFICDNGVRKFQRIYNVFKHVFCYEYGTSTNPFELGTWKICAFYEQNKSFLKSPATSFEQSYP